VESIAGSPSVLSIAPRFSGEAPPAYEIRAGRIAIRSDPYYNGNLPPSTQIALLDTGVRMTHVLLAGRLGTCLDCVNGGTDCATGPNVDPRDVDSHGTASAAILAGNKSRGDLYRGVSGALVDSFRVYNGQQVLDRQAAQHGFARTLVMGQKVVVAEMQGDDGERGDLVVAADSAFDAGAVVVAATGNDGPGKLGTPASAHRVIGAGAYSLVSKGTLGNQGQGPTSDGRFKPDVQGPTDTWSASSAGNTATAQFGGTSGATPYVGGAAALLRDWNTAQPGGPSDPGQVYSQLILFGDRNSLFNPKTGAGRLRLRLDGMSWVGKVPVGNGDVIDIPLPVPSGMGNNLAAAIWWPETWQNGDVHNTITLAVADPSGVVSVAASTPNSVFERCTLTGNTSAGTWTVRIRGAAVPTAPQTVYWAAFIPHSTMRVVLRVFVAMLVGLVLRATIAMRRLLRRIARWVTSWRNAR
jgi:hypothetical protein